MAHVVSSNAETMASPLQHTAKSPMVKRERSATTPQRSKGPKTRSKARHTGKESSPSSNKRSSRKKVKRSSLPSDSPLIDLTVDEQGAYVEDQSKSLADKESMFTCATNRPASPPKKHEAPSPTDIYVPKKPKNRVEVDGSGTETGKDLLSGPCSTATFSSPNKEVPQINPHSPALHGPVDNEKERPSTSDCALPRPEYSPSVDIDSSPLKRFSTTPQHETSGSPQMSKRHVAYFSSSPMKRRKFVTFSDKLAEVPSSPLCRETEQQETTPRRSILKQSPHVEEMSPVDPNNSAMWVKSYRSLSHSFSTSNHSPGNPLFWQPGAIIQLEYQSYDLPQLVDGCIDVLRDPEFDKKFEVYATLNLIFKGNDAGTLAEVLSGETTLWLEQAERATGYKPKVTTASVGQLAQFAQRDIIAIESKLFIKNDYQDSSRAKNNPFESRALNQAMKLVGNFLAAPSINQLIPTAEIKWFYSHACDIVIRPTISKSLISPYLCIIKDCHFSPKKRKLILDSFPNPISEKILFALLNMKNFLSTSLINEKFIALRNFVQNFPSVSAKNFHHWFPGLLVNLCDLSFILYSKVIGTGVTTLLEAARNYLDNTDICAYTRNFLENPLPTNINSWITDSSVSLMASDQKSVIDYVVDSLKELLGSGQFKYAMDIWVGLTLLLGNFDKGLENWKNLGAWLQVHKLCFNDRSILAKETALSSWKVIVYKICCHDLRDIRLLLQNPLLSPTKSTASPNSKLTTVTEDVLKPKIKLLIHPFMCISDVGIRKELVDGFHNCFLSILYNLLNYQPKSTSKYLQIYWDRIIQPVLVNFYFKKNSSNKQMHQLGLAIMCKLLRPSMQVIERSYSNIRCLSNDSIDLNEINPLNPRWVHLRFEKVLPIISLMFNSDHLSFDEKAEALNAFLNTIKYVSKKEVQLSDTTYDLIDNLPLCLEILLSKASLNYDSLFKLALNINDTFGAPHLVPSNESIRSVFEVMLCSGLLQMPKDQLYSVIGMWLAAIGERKNLRFLQILNKLCVKHSNSNLADFIAEALNNKKTAKFSTQEMIIIGQIFKTLDSNFSNIAKRLIQQIVLMKADGFESMVAQLSIGEWNINIFKFFVVLMHDAPYDHLKHATVKLIAAKSTNMAEFSQIIVLLFENKFTYEIHSLRHLILSTINKSLASNSEVSESWTSFISEFNSDDILLDDILFTALEVGLKIGYLFNGRWEKLTRTKEAWIKLHGNSISDGSYVSLQPNLENNTVDVSLDSYENERSLEGVRDSEESEPTEDQRSQNSIVDTTNPNCFLANEVTPESMSEKANTPTKHEAVPTIEIASNNFEGEHTSSVIIEISSSDDSSGPGSIEVPCNNSIQNEVDHEYNVLSSLGVHKEQNAARPPCYSCKQSHRALEIEMKESKCPRMDKENMNGTEQVSLEESAFDSNQGSGFEGNIREKKPRENPGQAVEIVSTSEEELQSSGKQNKKESQKVMTTDTNLFQPNSDETDQRELASNVDSCSDVTIKKSTEGASTENASCPESASLVYGKLKSLHETLGSFKNSDMAQLPPADRYTLETEILKFVLRMRELPQ